MRALQCRLLTALWQVHLQCRREDERRGDHKEDEQQEDDIGHRRHAEHRQGFVLSFQCHSRDACLLGRLVEQVHEFH